MRVLGIGPRTSVLSGQSRFKLLVGAERIELSTSVLSGQRSTTELCAHQNFKSRIHDIVNNIGTFYHCLPAFGGNYTRISYQISKKGALSQRNLQKIISMLRLQIG